jgi:NAD(P)-dependent dehydrogenase (short-subunit alcohol dehydrogenase family)
VDPGAGAYGLAKKSLRDATEAAALEWAPEIRVNGVAPGFVLPPPGVSPEKMEKFLPGIPMRRAATPEEIADACWFLATAPILTGQILFVDGGLHLTANPVAEKPS